MAIRFVLCSAGLVLALIAPAPVLAAQACLANGKSFKIGETACLTIAGESHLARCDMVLNNTSWTKIHDDCRGTTPPVMTTPISTPAPSMVPTEPTEN
ncbi:MAG: hypothetical protein EOS54_23950 [Mesorhizobium sp.]|uniref:hypothetical protein n=1 Tax=unclassified Mesorhizobium TaxID=325217 RepID=UPI000F75D610|nr:MULTISPECIES: hypothetical protein [unclassified Mesorhizobium]RVC46350.1 hypothetical protein EN781_05890 [Mesorhizobium sp. M4A.F.Ca.ET.090.04.2.1]AZO46699.1 hypothetical protein EJ073_01935 [Mesorhizobium sp. M4B.F.Ca.ET.058.02.1.1]RVC76485.1 hypothetical protein EN745_24600 [Mesorhizobium sp. M4A.F.Ca.ET.022.05.2.1]RVD39463.1 hypothetical protein EN742_15130 [Mesorhizobium sp. M4A.F.Ca.ET.020.02.1.1]RWC21971.1 MAG: hypothetical protein EOS53_03260 [Mesorhizobium sp.]